MAFYNSNHMQHACQTIFLLMRQKIHFDFLNEDIFLTVMVHFTQMKKSGFYLVYLEYRAVWDAFNLR